MKETIKKTMQKIILLICLIVIVSGSIVPSYVQADVTKKPSSVGGTLSNPIKSFLTLIPDAFMNVIQSVVFTQKGSKFSAAVEGLTFNVKPGDDARDGGNWWDDTNDNDVAYPGYLYVAPETIFSNRIAFLNADFVNGISDYSKYVDKDKYKSSITTLREQISKWYVAIRTLALVGLLSVLVYIGIRIIISSASVNDKAKYKQMFTYWLSAIVLLFTLHYLMSFTMIITNKLTEIMVGKNKVNVIETQYVGTTGGDGNEFKVSGSDKTDFSNFLDGVFEGDTGSFSKSDVLDGDKIIGVVNFSQYARLYANLTGMVGWRYLIVYIALVAYTVYFFFIYTKRVIYMAFLTLIAPLITLTYPLDKLKDGQAQAFSVWIKEYVFNALLQPFHLLIYTIFIGTAIKFATDNLVYTIVVLAFMTQAEKLLRKMFGFDRATTAGAFSGAATGSLIANAISKAGSKAKGGGGSGGNGGNGGNGGGGSDDTDVRTIDNDDPYAGYGQHNLPGTDDNDDQQQLPEGENPQDTDEIPSLYDDDTQELIDSERDELEGLREEMNDPDSDFSDEDRAAFAEMEQEQEAREQAFRDRQEEEEQARMAAAQEAQEEQEEHQEEQEGIREDGQEEAVEDGQQEQPEQIEQPAEGEQGEDQDGGQHRLRDAYNRARNSQIGKGVWEVGARAGRKIGSKTGMHLIRGWKDMSGKERAKSVLREAGRGFKTLAPKALKAGTRYTAAAGAGILAGSAALISGDPKAIVSATTLAATGGKRLGAKAADKVGGELGSVSDTFRRGYYGSDYKKMQADKENDKWERSQETNDKFKQEFGDQSREAIEEGRRIREQTGTTDDSAIIAALKTTEKYGHKPESEAIKLDEARNLPLMDKHINPEIFNDRKAYETQRDKIAEQLTRKHGVNTSTARQEAERALRNYAKYKGKSLPTTGTRTQTEQPQQQQPRQQQPRQQQPRQQQPRQQQPQQQQPTDQGEQRRGPGRPRTNPEPQQNVGGQDSSQPTGEQRRGPGRPRTNPAPQQRGGGSDDRQVNINESVDPSSINNPPDGGGEA